MDVLELKVNEKLAIITRFWWPYPFTDLVYQNLTLKPEQGTRYMAQKVNGVNQAQPLLFNI